MGNTERVLIKQPTFRIMQPRSQGEYEGPEHIRGGSRRTTLTSQTISRASALKERSALTTTILFRMAKPRSLLGIVILALLFSPIATAQNSAVAPISGTVTDAQRQPVPGANVFIAGSQRGTATDANGHYRLDNIPLGVHRLVASIIGFETKAEDLNLRRAGESKTVDFRMEEAVLELGQVTVESTEDVEWQRRYERFKRRFIGESPNAAETEILNPFVLNFSDRRGELKAEASEPLIIENYALGYRIRYDLTDFEARSNYNFFHGEPLFEEIVPEDRAQAVLWQANRARAYAGSFRHALRSLLANNVEEQGFHLFLLPNQGPGGGGVFGRSGGSRSGGNRFPTTPEEILKPKRDGEEFDLEFHGILQMIYVGEPEDPSYLESEWVSERRTLRDVQTSEWRFPIPEVSARLDRFGEEVDPRSITVSGYMTFDRLADDLPIEYGLAESGIPGAADAIRAWQEEEL